ncbi:MAG: 2-C-methyl-D-erythritol 4-phosphate cytidylyltransferase [Nitrospirae bacterium]|nr:2-C-methyl-D-erythritol 4-phosphate cytidylyltransferase [Nitrospirota bacterium]
MKQKKTVAIVPSAGQGKRLGLHISKPFVLLIDKPLIAWTLITLNSVEEISEIIPVFRQEDTAEAIKLIERFSITKIKRIASGGSERQDSVLNGLRLIGDSVDIVLVHDGVRALVKKSLIENSIAELEGYDGVITAVPPKDTIKETDDSKMVIRTHNRSALWSIQTPQVFPFKTLLDAHEKALSDGFYSTDDSALVERLGGKIKVLMGSYKNIKVTTPEDILVAEALMKTETGNL